MGVDLRRILATVLSPLKVGWPSAALDRPPGHRTFGNSVNLIDRSSKLPISTIRHRPATEREEKKEEEMVGSVNRTDAGLQFYGTQSDTRHPSPLQRDGPHLLFCTPPHPIPPRVRVLRYIVCSFWNVRCVSVEIVSTILPSPSSPPHCQTANSQLAHNALHAVTEKTNPYRF